MIWSDTRSAHLVALIAAIVVLALPAVASAAAPVSQTDPTLTGNPHPGNTLTCVNGDWDGSYSYTFQFYRDDDVTPIGGTTDETYDVVPGDVGHSIKCKVTADNGADLPVQSAASNALDVTPVPPSISYSQYDDKISGDVGTAPGSGVTVHVVLYRAGRPVSSASGPVSAADGTWGPIDLSDTHGISESRDVIDLIFSGPGAPPELLSAATRTTPCCPTWAVA
jgi:hypothetical protein